MSKRLTDHDRTHMRERIPLLLSKRKQMAKFPFKNAEKTYAYWRTLIDPNVISAIDTLVLSKYKAIVEENPSVTFRVGDMLIYASTNNYLPWREIRGGVLVPSDDPKYSDMLTFATNYYQAMEDNAATEGAARSLIITANAAGQIKRVWPELASFLSEEAGDSLRTVERVSRIPNGFNIEEFNANRALYDRVLAEAHILSKAERTPFTFRVTKIKPE